jgi:hypothetical protein
VKVYLAIAFELGLGSEGYGEFDRDRDDP